MQTPKAPVGFVRGGTTTGAYDKQLAEQRADIERRRAITDAKRRIVRDQQSREDGAAVMRTHLLGGQHSQHPMVVLAIKRPKQMEFDDWITCELSEQGEAGELALIIACPRCILTMGRPSDQSQITILQSNRAFTFEPRAPKWMWVEDQENRIWRNPKNPDEIISVAGTIHMHEFGRCPHLGCGFQFTIDDSVLYPK